MSDSENFSNSEHAQFKVNVKGPLDKGKPILDSLLGFVGAHKQLTLIYAYLSSSLKLGKMHLWARPAEDGAWSVTRIELEVNKHPNKRLLIKDGPKFEQQEPQPNVELQQQQQ